MYIFQFFRDELQNTDGFERQSIFHGKDKQISVRDLWHAWKKSVGMIKSSKHLNKSTLYKYLFSSSVKQKAVTK